MLNDISFDNAYTQEMLKQVKYSRWIKSFNLVGGILLLLFGLALCLIYGILIYQYLSNLSLNNFSSIGWVDWAKIIECALIFLFGLSFIDSGINFIRQKIAPYDSKNTLKALIVLLLFYHSLYLLAIFWPTHYNLDSNLIIIYRFIKPTFASGWHQQNIIASVILLIVTIIFYLGIHFLEKLYHKINRIN